MKRTTRKPFSNPHLRFSCSIAEERTEPKKTFMIQLAVFDIAGTTVKDDDFVAKAIYSTFEKKGIRLRNIDAGPLMGYPKPVAIQMILEHQGIEPDAELVRALHGDFIDGMISFYASSPDVEPLPGAEEIFRYLKQRGAFVALNTGFSRNIAEVIVNRFAWSERGLIDAFIGSDEVAKGRPHPDMIFELKRRLNLSADAPVMKVGDTIVDIQEGRAAGCKFNVGVTTGACAKDELEQQQPTHIINYLLEIPVVLQASQAYA
jgi:phosphonatase-like hydrolase